MSSFSSTIQILVVEEKQIPARNGREAFVARSGRAILFADDGSVTTVGRLRIPDSLADQAKQGTYRAAFSLQVPDYGNDKGDIVAVLTGLTPVERKAPGPAKA